MRGTSTRELIYRGIGVATSVALFATCLSRTAFWTPLTEVQPPVANGAFELFCLGWIALFPAVVSLFIAHPVPPLFVIILAAWLARKGWKASASVAAVIALPLVWRNGTIGFLAWLANPALAVAWALYVLNRSYAAFISSTVAFVLSLGFLTLYEMPFGLKNATVPILSHGAGYWLWVASAGVMLLFSGSERLLMMQRYRSSSPCLDLA